MCSNTTDRGDAGEPGQRDQLQRAVTWVSRRRMLGATTAVSGMTLAGCIGTGGESDPDPVTIAGDAACDECGMVISKHPGPNGELYWADVAPGDHDEPFRFDSLKQCLFPHYFDGIDGGQTLEAGYVTDYSTVEYSVSTTEGSTYISSTTAGESLARLEDMWYVVGSDVQGAMGPDFVPFGTRSDAESFASEYEGTVVEFDEITPALTGR